MSSLQKFHRRTQPFKVNTLHTGTVSISGTSTRDQVLTATNNISDADGLGTFAYQWKRSGTAISGATSSTYTLAAADVGNTITVTITYTDGKGFIETETSAATATVVAPKPIGSGSATTGYYLGFAGDGTSYMYAAPKSTEVQKQWGSYGVDRNTLGATNGLANTNTLVSFGTSAHPAAGHCKYLSTGGYNTWYLPASNELTTMFSNRSATPFATADDFNSSIYWSSTQQNAYRVGTRHMVFGGTYITDKRGNYSCRAVRRSLI
jgi:hypothetical protein